MAQPMYKGIFDNTKSYPELSIVQDNDTQNAILYISTKSVPIGSSIFDSTYWVKYNKGCGLTEGEVEEMITSYCGDLEDLQTEDKSSLVNAINELDDEHEALSGTVSDIVDGTIEIPHQCDWNESDSGAKDFIKNKPFDNVNKVVVLEDEEVTFDTETNLYSKELAEAILSSDDIGKVCYLTFNDKVLSASVVESSGTLYAVYNYDVAQSSVIDDAKDAFMIAVDDTTSIIVYDKDDGTDPINVDIYFKTYSKLDGSKIEVDNDTIKVNENGELWADVDVPIATTEVAGKVKPDGETITADENGVISAVGGGSSGWTYFGNMSRESWKTINVEFNELLLVYQSNFTGKSVFLMGTITKDIIDRKFADTSSAIIPFFCIEGADICRAQVEVRKNGNDYQVYLPLNVYKGTSQYSAESNKSYIYYR